MPGNLDKKLITELDKIFEAAIFGRSVIAKFEQITLRITPLIWTNKSEQTV